MKPFYMDRQSVRFLFVFFAVVLLIGGFASIATAKGISTAFASPSELQGTYSVITSGCNATDDPGSVAILKKEGTPYDFKVVAPSSASQVAANLRADDALTIAENFVQCSPDSRQTELTRITAPDGTIIGYEMKPVFAPLRFGSTDAVDTRYEIKGDRVVAYVTEDPIVRLDDMGAGG